jgi:hypothetical protein
MNPIPRIENVHVTLVDGKEDLLGVGSCQVIAGDFQLLLANIAIKRRPEGGFYLQYPAQVQGVTRFPHYRPVNDETAAQIEKAVLDGFREACERQDDETRPLVR